MRKVLFASHTANFQKFNHPFMKWFKEQGYEVHYASMGEEKILHCDKHFKICFNRSPYSLENLKAYRDLKKLIQKQSYEIIHCHTPMGSVVTRLAAREARKKSGTRVIYTAHGFHFYKGAPLQNWLFYYPVEKLLSIFTDVLVTINEEDYLRSLRRMHAKQIVKINGVGVNLAKFRPVRDNKEKLALRRKYGFKKEDLILICVAELNGNKNQEFLIKNISKLVADIPSIKLLLCGDGGFKSKYSRLITELGLSESIHLLGYRDDVDELLRMSDIGVAASLREGFGLSVVEELASGLPVLATNNRGHKEIITSSLHGSMYPVNDTEAFRKAVINLVPLDRRKAKARHNESKKFSVEESLNTMAIVYELSPPVLEAAEPESYEGPVLAPMPKTGTLFYSKLPTIAKATTRVNSRSKKIRR